ncbi:MAG TPA: MBL fold metallo-hydrolase [Candidatus Limnocylindrales bacterium]
MSDLIVRAYDVRFGDAIFVSVPDMENGQLVERTILFDFGNSLGTEGGADAVFEPVIDDLIARLGGRPLDLYVMTHEHLDHVQGLFFSAKTFNKRIHAKQAWLTGSSDPHYYDGNTHPGAKKQKIAALAAMRLVGARLTAAQAASPFVGSLLAVNDPKATADCIDFLRTQLTDPGGVHYVDRTTDLGPLWTGPGTIELLAPEANTADYYGAFKGFASGLGKLGIESFDDLDGIAPTSPPSAPPSGVDAGAFYNLLDVRHGAASTLLEIDQAANNTSIVLLLEWKGWRLLFSGDAEKRSWRMMDARTQLAPVHFLKISHHGSGTGLPPDPILEKVLPKPAAGQPVTRRAIVSTFPNTYRGVPDTKMLTSLGDRVQVFSTRDEPHHPFVELRFPDTGPG